VVTASDVETGERVGAPIAFDGAPRRLLPSRDGRRLFVLLHGESGAVAAVDVGTRTFTGTVKVGQSMTNFAAGTEAGNSRTRPAEPRHGAS
jgi:DNA-binding beta-propeller fold protein YncE